MAAGLFPELVSTRGSGSIASGGWGLPANKRQLLALVSGKRGLKLGSLGCRAGVVAPSFGAARPEGQGDGGLSVRRRLANSPRASRLATSAG